VTEEGKAQPALKRLKWFADIVENVPRAKGDSFTDKVIDIQSANVVARAGKVAMEGMGETGGSPSAERGVSQGLEAAGRKIVEKKLLAEDPISSRVLETLGEVFSEDLKARLTGGSGMQSADAKELADRRRKDDLDALLGQIKTELIQPLTEQIQTVAAKVEEKPQGGALTTEDAVDMVMNAQAKAKELLEKQGFSVENVNVTKETVSKMLEEERGKQAQHEAELKAKWEEERGANVEIEKDRIHATENILTSVVDRVMDVFLVPIKDKIQEAIEKGAFARAAGP